MNNHIVTVYFKSHGVDGERRLRWMNITPELAIERTKKIYRTAREIAVDIDPILEDNSCKLKRK